MQVILRTLCGCEQALELDPHQPIPHVIVVHGEGAAAVARAFRHLDRTDRYPRRVYLETSAAALPTDRVATFERTETPAAAWRELDADLDGRPRRDSDAARRAALFARLTDVKATTAPRAPRAFDAWANIRAWRTARDT